MSNEYYTATGNPATGATGSSAVIRNEYSLIQSGFAKLPALAGNGLKIVRVNSAGNGMEAVAGTSAFAETFGLPGIITPPQITAHQHNYNPTGLSTATVLRLSSSGAFDITGIVGGTNGRVLVLHNVGTNNIVLRNEDSDSSAANRMIFGESKVTLQGDRCAMLQYDATVSRWRLVARTGAEPTTGQYSLKTIVRYTTAGSGTYNKSTDVNALLIRACGGGGGGSGGQSSSYGGFGGGGGGYAEKFITSPSTSYAYIVGAGGGGGAVGGSGSPGGSTTIAGMTANGGGNGAHNQLGSGGTASGGDINVRGNSGYPPYYGNFPPHGGPGGASFLGGGGHGSLVAGVEGTLGGGGGGGGVGYQGGNGGAGYIEIWEFI